MRFILKIFRIYRVIRTQKHLARLLSKSIRSAKRLEKQTAILGVEDIGNMNDAASETYNLLHRAYWLLKLSSHPFGCCPEMQKLIKRHQNPEKTEDSKKE